MNFYQAATSILMLGMTIIITWSAFKKRSSRNSAPLISFSIGLAGWIILYSLSSIITQKNVYTWLGIMYLVANLTRLSLFVFALYYSDTANWLNKRTLSFLLIEPLVTLAILLTNPLHGFFFARITREVLGRSVSFGPWFWITTVYNFCLLLATILILGQTYLKPSRANRSVSGLLFLGMLAPLILYIVTLAGSEIIPGADLSPIIFLVPSLTIIIGLLRNDLLEYSIQSRDRVIEVMNDGWMVLDENNNVIDINPFAETLIGRTRRQVFGLPVKSVLSEWSNLLNIVDNPTIVLDTNFSVEIDRSWRYINMRVQPIINNGNETGGHVISWRDITDQKKVEDSRKQTRDDQFLLIRGLANAASEAPDLEYFFSESIYLVMSIFQSQTLCLFLLDDERKEGDPFRLSLVHQVGLSPMTSRNLSHIKVENSLPGSMYHVVLERKGTYLSPNMELDQSIPDEIKDLGPGSLIISALRSNNQLLGMVCQVRKIPGDYSAEDRMRFQFVIDDISNFIYNDRQRQLAIGLAERSRLVRDLHDSVTQKLYGLLALTEAAQAGLEMGSMEMSKKVLSPIGEHARQALKEMRLFLYELSPSNLKKDGLIATLNQRLDAVEGRADMKRKIISDDDIYLTNEQQVAFYYIAQEALNNTLRHAHAKSVQISLKQTENDIIMEIEDDGVGFDTNKKESGGIGSRSMRERSEQIGANLEVHSKPGEGTRVALIMKKNGG
jgi:PAS domain S-box-containing protein